MWILKYMAVVMLAVAFLSSPALAKEHAGKAADFGKANQKLGRREKGPKYLQLESFMAPAMYQGRNSTLSLPVTIILKINRDDKVGAICRITPRIRDAMMVSLFANPIPIKRGKAEFDKTRTQLLDAINKSLGADMVSEVVVLSGARRINKGAAGKLPFSSSGCAEVKKMEVEKKKMEKKKN